MSDGIGTGGQWFERSEGKLIGSQTGESSKVSILNIYKILATYMQDYEKSLKDSLASINGQSASEIDQGTLLELQSMVQTWGTISATSTGIVRSIGDTLSKITQNIR
ncbi:MAG: hypothetical protein LBI37_01485 [Puniceicoccales bacterium]|jgi:hypothetical protein|nr:hypothetical protein [Puniceicoccales bacterium]